MEREVFVIDINKFSDEEKRNILNSHQYINKEYKKNISDEKSLLEHIVGYWLIQYMLKNKFKKNKTIYRDSLNKPYIIDDNKIEFNISHSNQVVCGVISDSEIGVDIEYIDDIDNETCDYFMNEEEKNLFYKKPLFYYQLWTAKESIMKFLGKGFHINPLEIDCNFRKHKISYQDNELYFQHNLLNNNYYISVCENYQNLLKIVELNYKNVV